MARVVWMCMAGIYRKVLGISVCIEYSEKLSYEASEHTAISRKVVGKSARDNTERYCGWF